MKLGPGRLFGFFYLIAWCAALAALAYFASDLPRSVSILGALLLLFLAPDIGSVRRLLSGAEDGEAGRGPRE